MQKAGGTFTLTADVDFGATYGLKSVYYKSRNTPSTAGIVRLGNNESVGWRNAANSANLELKVNASNKLEFDGQDIPTLDIGAADTVMQMNAGGTTWEFAKIDNANVDAAAAIAYSKLNLATSIVDADVAVAAAIARSKLASGTASYVLINSGAGVMSEEQYLDRTRGGTGITSTATFPSSGTITTDAGTSVLTNKDFDGGTASNTSRITVPKAAFATIDGLTDKEGTIAFDTDAKKLVVNDGAAWNAVGSGSSGRNYLSDWYDASKSESVGTSAATSTGNRTVAGNTDPTKWVTSDLTNLTFTKSTDTTLRQSYNYLINSGDANADFVESPLFTLDGSDLGKPISVSFDCAGVSASDDYQVCAVRYNSSGTYQEVITIAGTASATTPYSARIPVGTTSFNGFFVAGSTATDQYAIRFMKHAVNVDLRIDSLYVGPQSVVQGAAVTDWVSYTPTLSDATNATVNYSKWRRVGSEMEVAGAISWSGAGAGTNFTVSIPSGYSLDSSILQLNGKDDIGSASWNDSGTGYKTLHMYTTGTTLIFKEAGTTNLWDGTQAANNDYITFNAKFPVANWSSNVTMANRAVESFTADDGSSDVFGAAGALVPNQAFATGVVSRVFNFQDAITPTDAFVLEVSAATGYPFMPAASFFPFASGNNSGTTNYYGMRMYFNTPTQMTVDFGSQGSRISSSAASNGADSWATYYTSGARFRVRKVSGGAAVGYPVSTANIVGRTDGVTVGSSYIGEKLSATSAGGVTPTSGQKSDGGNSGLTLTPGVWLIQTKTTITVGTMSALTSYGVGYATSAGNASFAGNYNTHSPASHTPSGNIVVCSPWNYVNISTSTTYYPKVQVNATVGTATVSNDIEAVRIA